MIRKLFQLALCIYFYHNYHKNKYNLGHNIITVVGGCGGWQAERV